MRSAPREFAVESVRDDGSRELLVNGIYALDDTSQSLQTFFLREPLPTRSLRLAISSNHGHPDYTCLYRFMVHGVLY